MYQEADAKSATSGVGMGAGGEGLKTGLDEQLRSLMSTDIKQKNFNPFLKNHFLKDKSLMRILTPLYPCLSRCKGKDIFAFFCCCCDGKSLVKNGSSVTIFGASVGIHSAAKACV